MCDFSVSFIKQTEKVTGSVGNFKRKTLRVDYFTVSFPYAFPFRKDDATTSARRGTARRGQTGTRAGGRKKQERGRDGRARARALTTSSPAQLSSLCLGSVGVSPLAAASLLTLPWSVVGMGRFIRRFGVRLAVRALRSLRILRLGKLIKPKETKAKNVRVKFGNRSVKVSLTGVPCEEEVLCDGETWDQIDVDGSTFTLQNEPTAQPTGRELCVTLEKKNPGQTWNFAIE